MTEPQTEALNSFKPGEEMQGRRRGDGQAEDGCGARRPRLWTAISLAVLTVVLATSAAYLFASFRPVLYGARAEVLFEPGQIRSAEDAEALAATRQVIAGSRAILEPVALQYGIAVDRLEEIVEVAPIRGSNVTRFTVAHPDPEQARILAQAIADRYVESLQPRAAVAALPIEEYVRTQIDELTAAQVQIEGQLGQIAAAREVARGLGQPLPYPAEEPGLAARSEQLQRRIGDLYQRLDELELDRAQARALTPAYVLEKPVAPDPVRSAVAGALVGLVLASGMVVAVTQRRARA